MKLAKKYPVLGSSKNPENVSLMLKGLSVLIVSLAAMKGIHIEEAELFNSLMLAVTSTTTLVSAIATLYGLVRKFR